MMDQIIPDEGQKSAASGGLKCPVCHCRHFMTTHTRPHPRGVKRYKECRNCGRQVTTIEKIDENMG